MPRALKADPSAFEAAERGVLQGATLGWHDELAGALRALRHKLLPPTGGGKEDLSGQPTRQLYTEGRDEQRTANDAAKAAHPNWYRGGELAGGVATGALLPGARTVGSALRTAAAMGATAGLGESDTDLTSGRLKDVARATADTSTGALVGPATVLGVESARQALRPIGAALRATATKMGARVLTGGAKTMNQTRKAIDPRVVESSYREGAIKPLGSTAGTYERLESKVDEVGDLKHNIVKELKAAGVTGPEAEQLAQTMVARGRDVAAKNSDPAVRGVYDSEASALRATEPMGNYTIPRDSQGNLDLEGSESLKSNSYKRAKYNRMNVAETPQNEARKEVGSIYRQANEDAIDQQAAVSTNPLVRPIAERFVPIKQRLGPLIEARDIAEKGVAQASRRSAFSPMDLGAMMMEVTQGHGYGKGAGAAGVSSLLRQRMPSTVGWGAYQGNRLNQYIINALRNRNTALAIPGAEQLQLPEAQ